jgi:transcriptional regulator with XRE-family HTH domain
MLRSMEPSDLIRAVRRRGGLTQAELARRAGTSQPVVSAYEHGRRDPTFATLARLVAAGGERLLVDAAATFDGPPPATDDDERARRLVDVLLLSDAIPARRRAAELRAPRLVSS